MKSKSDSMKDESITVGELIAYLETLEQKAEICLVPGSLMELEAIKKKKRTIYVIQPLGTQVMREIAAQSDEGEAWKDEPKDNC